MTEDQHHARHEQLVEEIASHVETKIEAKIFRWVAINSLGLLLALIGGFTAFYELKHSVAQVAEKNGAQDERLAAIEASEREERANIDKKLDGIATRVDEINRFLRDHNQQMLSGTRR